MATRPATPPRKPAPATFTDPAAIDERIGDLWGGLRDAQTGAAGKPRRQDVTRARPSLGHGPWRGELRRRSITGVHDFGRLEDHNLALLVGARAVLDASSHDRQLTRP